VHSKAQATLLPATSVYWNMKNCKQQNRFLQSTKNGDRQGDRNLRVFLKAKLI